MGGIDKKACRAFLEPVLAPNSDCGLFLVPELMYIVRTAVKIIEHRRLLVLCLYARGDTPGSRPELTYTLFQSGDSFITYDHRSDAKNQWRTAMLKNLEQEYHFLDAHCAFYSRPDEMRAVNICKPYIAKDYYLETGFKAISYIQQQIRDKETLRRQKNGERKIRARLSGLQPLPHDLENWLRQKILPAYFFYDYKKGPKPIRGICSACGQEIELSGVRYNSTGICPHCGRKLTMKSNGKRGYIWDRATASVIQKYRGNHLIVRIVKASLSYSKGEPAKFFCYEEIRIIIAPQTNGDVQKEVYHHSNNSVGITWWKKGYPPVCYLYQQNFNAETCGYLYCGNLNRALKNTAWQYCQIGKFYEGVHNQMEVAPYLLAYLKIPAIEFFVKLKLFWLVIHVAYRREGEKAICPQGKNLREVLQIEPGDLPLLQRPEAGICDLYALRILRAEGHQPSMEFFTWLDNNDLTEPERLKRGLRYATPYKLMRYLDQQFSKVQKNSYRGNNGILSDYDDYLGFCEQLEYDLKNEFVLFPKHLKQAHDRAHDAIKLHRVEQYDPKIALMQKELERQYQFRSDGLVVLPPRSAQEIVREGQKLHHCVGSYVERVVNQNCVILFIRHEARKSKPFYTVEVCGGRILQVRGANNCAPVPKVEKFLSKWKKKKHLDEAA